MSPRHVKVRLDCRGARQGIDLCVQVERQVPEPLRCTPGGGRPVGSGTGPSFCAECDDLLKDGSRLRAHINDLTRGGWGRWVRVGSVVIGCGGS
jgi:hypothetical protein